MSAVIASLCSTLLMVAVFVSADQKNITAESGQDVTLTCRAPINNIMVVEWSRADLGDEYVLLYWDDHLHSDNQHPSFKNRVDLQDRQLKDGDVSLILNNVTINDTGTYKCRVLMEETQSWKLISIYLRVDPPGKQGGHTVDGGKEDGSVALIVGVCIPAVLLVGAVVFLIYRKHENKQSQDSASC